MKPSVIFLAAYCLFASTADASGTLNECLRSFTPIGQKCLSKTEFTGWAQQGFTWNPDEPTNRFNGPVGQNDRANEYQLNQLYLTARRPATPIGGGWGVGFQSDLIYGTDAFFFQALGFDDNIVSDKESRFYQLAFPQLYAELQTPWLSDCCPFGLATPGITLQVGKWFALVGYETGLATDDFFYSNTLGFNPTPYSHTGVLATIEFGDRWIFSHGLHRGSDVWEDNNNNLAYTGSVQWLSPNEQTGWTFAINFGPEQDERVDWQDVDEVAGPDAPGENLNRVIYSLTFEQVFNQWSYIASHDYFFQEGSERYGLEDAEAYGATQYLIYTVDDSLSFGARLELYRDDDGFVTSGFRSENATAPSLFTNLTLGLKKRFGDCLTLRHECRWDWQHRDSNSDTPAFDSGTSDDQFLFATSAVIAF